jgi:hypothetical protein
VSAIAKKERLICDIARLRRAEQSASARGDIAAVRADLEDMAGLTVTRAVASRLLAVSQTALDRRIAAGDIPVLLTPAGRREVPLHALLGLIQVVGEWRAAYPHDRHPLASVLRERRSEAERLSASALLADADRGGSRDGHRGAELRSLIYHRAVAQRLQERIVRDARDRLMRWDAQAAIDPRYAQRWQQILTQTPAQIARLISQDTPEMRDLRQSSPLAGVLSEPERRRVLAVADDALA